MSHNSTAAAAVRFFVSEKIEKSATFQQKKTRILEIQFFGFQLLKFFGKWYNFKKTLVKRPENV